MIRKSKESIKVKVRVLLQVELRITPKTNWMTRKSKDRNNSQ